MLAQVIGCAAPVDLNNTVSCFIYAFGLEQSRSQTI